MLDIEPNAVHIAWKMINLRWNMVLSLISQIFSCGELHMVNIEGSVVNSDQNIVNIEWILLIITWKMPNIELIMMIICIE
jgi:hypothetical protein